MMGTVPFEQVYDQIVTLAREAGTRRVVLFGLRARGTNLPKSDIDIAIEGCPDFAALEERLQAERWSLLRLDVINLDAPISEDLCHEIARDGRALYEKKRTMSLRSIRSPPLRNKTLRMNSSRVGL